LSRRLEAEQSTPKVKEWVYEERKGPTTNTWPEREKKAHNPRSEGEGKIEEAGPSGD